ncbi:MAG: glycosyltransferase [Chloroflexi bacterium]|nr:glycosyltransferase [Chloroflexota bacterium]
MRIVHLYKAYPPVFGGIEQHLRDLCEGLAARGHQVTALTVAPGRRTRITDRGGVRLITAAGLATLASTPLSLMQLWWARRLSADVVHLQMPYPPGDLAARLVAGAPALVVSYQSDVVRQRRLLAWYRPLLEQTLQRARGIMVSNPRLLDSSPWLAPHRQRCAIVPLGVDVSRFAPGTRVHHAPRIGFVGRLRYYKGLPTLIDACAQLPETVECLIAGDGPGRAALERQAHARGVASRLRFVGDVAESELPAFYRSLDLFVLPSHLRAEAFGIVLAEALASGVPCISTELGTGTSWVNQHGTTGLVVPPGDATALADAIRRLLADPGLRQQMATAARARALEQFDRRVMLDRVEQAYHRAVGGA